MIKTREQIEEKYKWNLEAVYPTLKDFDKDYNFILNNIDKYKDLKNHFSNSGKDLYEYLTFDYQMDKIIGKLFTYATRRRDEDLSNNKNMILYDKVRDLDIERDKINSYFLPEILKLDYKDIEQFYKEEPKLKEYEIILKRIFKEKEHILSEKEEKLLTSFSKTLSSSSDLYDLLSDSDMVYENITDEEGNLVEMNEITYKNYIESKDRRVRKEAYNSLYKSLKQFRNTFAKTLSSTIETNATLAKSRKYKNSIEAALLPNEIDPSIYYNLINTVNAHQEPMYKYFRLKKKILNLDKLYFYDVYTPIITDVNKECTFDKAKETVLKALEILGEDYQELLNKAFNERWIDIYHNKGKKSGAYSAGSFGTDPYVLLNFQNRESDITTIAHELGHSMHSYYSWHNQPIQTCYYTLFTAEVASTVNELLLSNYLYKNAKTKKEKLNILNKRLELFKSTLYRQTMFAEFELWLYEECEKNNNLNSDKITEKYKELLEKYFADTVVIDDCIAYEWTRIPHFYYNFYVYQYATGLSSACQIVKNILDDPTNGVANYKKFLKSGSSMDPVSELKLAGVDISTPEPIENAIQFFEETLDEFERLYEEEVK